MSLELYGFSHVWRNLSLLSSFNKPADNLIRCIFRINFYIWSGVNILIFVLGQTLQNLTFPSSWQCNDSDFKNAISTLQERQNTDMWKVIERNQKHTDYMGLKSFFKMIQKHARKMGIHSMRTRFIHDCYRHQFVSRGFTSLMYLYIKFHWGKQVSANEDHITKWLIKG